MMFQMIGSRSMNIRISIVNGQCDSVHEHTRGGKCVSAWRITTEGSRELEKASSAGHHGVSGAAELHAAKRMGAAVTLDFDAAVRGILP